RRHFADLRQIEDGDLEIAVPPAQRDGVGAVAAAVIDEATNAREQRIDHRERRIIEPAEPADRVHPIVELALELGRALESLVKVLAFAWDLVEAHVGARLE